jgi:hypothetical protein
MKRIGIVGLCLIAASVAGGLLTASASAALPEYASCAKVAKGAKGHYANSVCSEVAVGGEGKYEIESGFSKAAFTSKGGKTRLEASEVPEAMLCSATKFVGELTGSKGEKNIIATFSGCEAAGSKCNSAGAKPGTIVTNPLRGELGYIAGKGTGTPTVGVLLSQQETTYAAEFACEGLTARVHGPLIAEISGDINTLSTSSAYAFRQSGGIPQYTSFEGGTFLEDVWRWEFNRGSGFEPEGGQPSGLELTATATSEALEIKA